MTATRPILVFDGDCGFCAASADRARRWLRVPVVEPWQQLDLAALGLSASRCSQAVCWVGVDGRVVDAERAVAAAMCHRGGAWAVLGRLTLIPGLRHIAGVIYRALSRNRHRLPGGSPACSNPRL